jgi:hypothetical protein
MNLQRSRRSAAAVAAAVVLGLGAAACTSSIPEADHSVPAPPGLVQFRGDFDTGDNSQWELETAKDYSLTIVDDGPGHPTAARFEVRDGDTPVDSGERSEVRAEDRYDVSDGDERWYSFSLKFDKGFSNPGGWCIPMQWHGADEDGDATDGSPQLNLDQGRSGGHPEDLPEAGQHGLPQGLPQARTVSGPRDIGHDGRLVRRCDRVDARGVAQLLAGT